MIIFFSEGRLGNQVFQYAFLRTQANKNEKIISIGMDDLNQTFIKDRNHINFKRIKHSTKLYTLAKILITLLATTRLIRVTKAEREKILGSYTRETTRTKSRKGLINRINFVETGFFQSDYFFSEEVAAELAIKPEHLAAPSSFMQKIKSEKKFFIHIRRGDYLTHTVLGKSALLPLSYFYEAIKQVRERFPQSALIFFSDDYDFINQHFGHIENIYLSNLTSASEDFACMTLCNGAILSPSSFSWWAAYLMKSSPDNVYAPQHWLGFNSQIDYHSSPIPTGYKKIDAIKLEKQDA
ncbi:alpha-1,2-fucosyltransferase [Pokkaliibacter sp. CJK22405]|uniref:alpha-1,2-fucosyltransferase n=1 Tax=Pokkaliibacter sp. CJK22405 TaxID=3384615 RepID=UPI0039848C49